MLFAVWVAPLVGGILFAESAGALPYTPFKQNHAWMLNHSFFPVSHMLGGGTNTMIYRELTEKRIVSFELLYKGFDEIADDNTASSEVEELVVQSACPKLPDQTPVVSGFFLNLIPSNHGYCEHSREFFPISRTNPQLAKMFHLVYGAQSQVLLEDLTKAKMVFEGERYYRYASHDGDYKQLIKNGPLSYAFFSGKRFDYVLTSFGFVVAMKSAPYIQKLIQEVKADKKLHDDLIKKESLQKPFDF